MRMMQVSDESPIGQTTGVLTAEFREQLQRSVDRINSLPLERVERVSDGGSIAQRVYDISLAMVRNTEALTGLDPRPLPSLRAHGVGAQLAVVGEEFATASLAAATSATADLLSIDLTLITQISDLVGLRQST